MPVPPSGFSPLTGTPAGNRPQRLPKTPRRAERALQIERSPTAVRSTGWKRREAREEGRLFHQSQPPALCGKRRSWERTGFGEEMVKPRASTVAPGSFADILLGEAPARPRALCAAPTAPQPIPWEALPGARWPRALGLHWDPIGALPSLNSLRSSALWFVSSSAPSPSRFGFALAKRGRFDAITPAKPTEQSRQVGSPVSYWKSRRG
ncbi:uncharacterized protein VSU04_013590 [Chlamydotis macqueenii]